MGPMDPEEAQQQNPDTWVVSPSTCACIKRSLLAYYALIGGLLLVYVSTTCFSLAELQPEGTVW